MQHSLYFIEYTLQNYSGGKVSRYHVVAACNRASDRAFTINQPAAAAKCNSGC